MASASRGAVRGCLVPYLTSSRLALTYLLLLYTYHRNHVFQTQHHLSVQPQHCTGFVHEARRDEGQDRLRERAHRHSQCTSRRSWQARTEGSYSIDTRSQCTGTCKSERTRARLKLLCVGPQRDDRIRRTCPEHDCGAYLALWVLLRVCGYYWDRCVVLHRS